MNEQKHPDVVWHTTEHEYEGRKILLKSRRGHGMKAHVFKPGELEIDFSLRFVFITPEKLLQKCKEKIDRQIKPKRIKYILHLQKQFYGTEQKSTTGTGNEN